MENHKAVALALITLIAISCLSLPVVKPANAQAINVQPVSSPVIIATPTPTPRPTPLPTPSPSPTPVPNVSLDYDEVSQITQGEETVVTLRVTAAYNFGDAIIYNYQNFVLDIRTSRGGLEPYPIYMLTGTAKPLETGSVTVGGNNRNSAFTLTFRFPTIQNSFGGPMHFAYYELVYNSNAISTPTASPSVPEFKALILTPLIAAVLFAVIALKVKSKRVDGIWRD